MRLNHLAAIALCGFLALSPTMATSQTPSGTAFTYQGRLNSSGAPASGNHDFKFRLYNAASGGSQVGAEVMATADVDGGLFSHPLDFGPAAFAEEARWLEIEVKVSGAGDYTLLTPRQRITPAPAAIHASTAGNGIPEGFFILGDTSTAPPGFEWTGKKVSTGETEQWVAKANMSSPQAYLVSGTIGDYIYVVGAGFAAKYYPPLNGWQPIAQLPTGRSAAAAAVVDGKLYVIGGGAGAGYLNANEMYDPATNTWTPKAPMPTARGYFGVGVIDGKIHAVGGHTGAVTGLTTVHEVYDPVTNTWSTRAALPIARQTFATGVIDRKLYVVGGAGNTAGLNARNERYVPETDSWQLMSAFLPGHSSVTGAVLDDHLYIFGGNQSGGSVKNTSVYHPDPGWDSRAPMITARESATAAAYGSKIYVFGGYQTGTFPDPGTFINSTEEYTPLPASYFVHEKQ